MKNAEATIGGIKRKVEQLIASCRRLEKENAQLYDERERLTREKVEREKIIRSLEAKIKILETSRSMVEVSGSTKAAKYRLNRILREIDKCIALINK